MVYTCVPSCCFNHVCAECRASFTLATEVAVGEVSPAESSGAPVERPEDPTAPTAPCARCGSLAVGSGPEGLACLACHARLSLRVSDLNRNS